MYKIDKICVYLGNAGLIFMVLSIVVDVVGRSLFGKPLPSIQQLDSELVMNLIVWLGVSYVFLMDKHVKVDFIAARLPKRIQTFLDYFCNLGVVVYFLAVGYYTVMRAMQALVFGQVSAGVLEYPLWPIYILAPIGCFLMIVRVIQVTVSKRGRNSIKEFKERELKAQSIGVEVNE